VARGSVWDPEGYGRSCAAFRVASVTRTNARWVPGARKVTMSVQTVRARRTFFLQSIFAHHTFNKTLPNCTLEHMEYYLLLYKVKTVVHIIYT
jgi:hypothetical protein